jgi:predicted transcriptional regulator
VAHVEDVSRSLRKTWQKQKIYLNIPSRVISASPFSSFYIKTLELNEMKEVNGSSKELMLKLLFDLGLTETEVSVYVFLTKKGPQKAVVIGNALNLYKQRLYRSLRKMQNKGVIEASGYPACFSAVPFERVIELAIKSDIEEAERMIQNKEELLSSWQSIVQNNSEN